MARPTAKLAAFLAACPEVSVDWFLHDCDANLIAEDIGCAIRFGGAQEPSLVDVQLAEAPRMLAASPGPLDPGGPPCQPADLQASPELSPPCSNINLLPLGTGRREQVRPSPRRRTDSLCSARRGVRERVGAALLSEWLVADDLATGRLCQFVPEWDTPRAARARYPHSRPDSAQSVGATAGGPPSPHNPGTRAWACRRPRRPAADDSTPGDLLPCPRDTTNED